MIRLNVFISVEAANHTKVLEAAKELTIFSVKEEGCVAYDIYESSTRPNVMLICETWQDYDALAKHEKTAHFAKNIVVLQQFAEIKLEKFEF